MSQHLDIPSLAVDCRKIIEDAVADLGPGLSGYSRLDLVADNLDYASLDDLRKALALIDSEDKAT